MVFGVGRENRVEEIEKKEDNFARSHSYTSNILQYLIKLILFSNFPMWCEWCVRYEVNF